MSCASSCSTLRTKPARNCCGQPAPPQPQPERRRCRSVANSGPLGTVIGMRRDFPPSGNGDCAPRLVVFEVINLEPLKRGSPFAFPSSGRQLRNGKSATADVADGSRAAGRPNGAAGVGPAASIHQATHDGSLLAESTRALFPSRNVWSRVREERVVIADSTAVIAATPKP
jgi:hypothetical protein